MNYSEGRFGTSGQLCCNWAYQEIELRTPNSFPALIFDVDTLPQDYLSIAFGVTVRPPNWIVSNPETGHAHIVYCFARPVLHGDGMRQKPLMWRQRIAEYYRMEYGADRGYAGVLTHNPVHPKWDTTWWRDEPWTLPELAEVIPKGWRIPPKPTTPEGRNVTLFNAALRWFGRPSNWDASTDLGDVHEWIGTRNVEWFNAPEQPPLDDNEVLWIAKSVCKISRKNLASGQTQQNFSFIQAAKGRRSGKARRKRTVERDAEIVGCVLAGESMRSVAREFGLALSTVHNIVARGVFDEPKQDD